MKIFNPIKQFLSKTQKIKRWQEANKLKKELDRLYNESPLLTKAQRDIIWQMREEYAEKQRETMIKYLKKEVDTLKNLKLKLQE